MNDTRVQQINRFTLGSDLYSRSQRIEIEDRFSVEKRTHGIEYELNCAFLYDITHSDKNGLEQYIERR